MSAERTRQAVIRQVNQLYGPDKVSRRRTRHDHREKEAEKQYYVQIGVERSELELPCTIQVMLGNDIVAGSMTIMAIPPTGRTNSEIQLNRGIKQLTSCVEDKVVVPLLEQELRIEIRKVSISLLERA